jgi:hypothetical protein
MAPSAPTAAASDGVARPKRIEPSTARISAARGRNDVTSANIIVTKGTLRSSFGNFGARLGLMMARAMT